MKKLIAALSGLFFASASFAAPPDFTTLTTSVDFSTVSAAILTIFAAIATVYILMTGGEMILGKLRRK